MIMVVQGVVRGGAIIEGYITGRTVLEWEVLPEECKAETQKTSKNLPPPRKKKEGERKRKNILCNTKFISMDATL